MAVTELRRPPRLRPGDRVTVVAPSGPVPADRLEQGVAILRQWGLQVQVAPHVHQGHPRWDYLAADDHARAADLQAAWLDPQVDAILCARGGYGAQRMMDLLDWGAMGAVAPKVFGGYSDITALHEAFATQLGVVTFHCPMPGGEPFLSDPRSAALVKQMLLAPGEALVLTSPGAHAVVPGTAEGVTLGGCVSLLADELGSPTARAGAAGGLLLLEEVDEDLYRLDRMFTQLLRSGWLDQVAGLVLGSWSKCPDGVHELVLDRFGGLGVPIMGDLGFGHGASSITVPLGVRARLDADAGTLTLMRPALS